MVLMPKRNNFVFSIIPDRKLIKNLIKVRDTAVKEAAICVWAAQGQPEDHLQGELQVRGPREISG